MVERKLIRRYMLRTQALWSHWSCRSRPALRQWLREPISELSHDTTIFRLTSQRLGSSSGTWREAVWPPAWRWPCRLRGVPISARDLEQECCEKFVLRGQASPSALSGAEEAFCSIG